MAADMVRDRSTEMSCLFEHPKRDNLSQCQTNVYDPTPGRDTIHTKASKGRARKVQVFVHFLPSPPNVMTLVHSIELHLAQRVDRRIGYSGFVFRACLTEVSDGSRAQQRVRVQNQSTFPGQRLELTHPTTESDDRFAQQRPLDVQINFTCRAIFGGMIRERRDG